MEGNESLLVGLGVAILCILITTAVWFFLSSKVGKRDIIALIGLSNAGKTLLYYRLMGGEYVDTYTSIKENSGRIEDTNGTGKFVQLLDIPGNDKLRLTYIKNQVDSFKGIILVVDSLNFQREMRDVASLLYDMLANRTINKYKVPILIACNKQDGSTAKSQKVIMNLLEHEIDKLRVTQTAALKDSYDDKEDIQTFVGKKDKEFHFSHVLPVRVDATECHATSLENDYEVNLAGVKEWIAKLM